MNEIAAYQEMLASKLNKAQLQKLLNYIITGIAHRVKEIELLTELKDKTTERILNEKD